MISVRHEISENSFYKINDRFWFDELCDNDYVVDLLQEYVDMQIEDEVRLKVNNQIREI